MNFGDYKLCHEGFFTITFRFSLFTQNAKSPRVSLQKDPGLDATGPGYYYDKTRVL